MKKFIFIVVVLLTLFGLSGQIFANDVHSVWSERLFKLGDGITGQWFDAVEGTATINWKDKTRYGFFHAIAYPSSPVFLEYEFILTSISNANDDYIEGFWDIWKNGVLVASGVVGKAYGVDAPVGAYFKLYCGDTSQNNNFKWHLSGYVTRRLDYLP